ncbi:MAG: FAD-binding oxidoreductase [Trueperaceae bacterium]|nr:FAD-binding oxidoreductase [Trueperaceae bacterium]
MSDIEPNLSVTRPNVLAAEPNVPAEAVLDFEARLRGDLIRRSDADYDEARALYNAMIDKRPWLIAQCVDVSDVIATVAFARDHGLPLAVRGGGHNGGGLGSVDDGVLLDLAGLNGVRIDAEARTARVEGGATWGKVDHAAHAFGLAVPSGIIASTGVGGLTLGGGLGHLTRRHGLTIDNLLEVDVVLADGRLVTANAHEHEDLFWAVRGGGGNFGVVTSFLFRLHPVDTVIGGPTFWALEDAADVMRWYRDFIREAPRDLNGFFAFLTVPPAPPFPEHLHGRKVCGIVWCYTGPPERADEVFAPVAAFGTPLMHGVQDMPFPALQSAFDRFYPAGHQWYWRADFFDELSDAAIAAHVEHGATMPTMQSSMHLYPIDGAAHDVTNDATPWSYRSANWAQVIVGVDPDPANAGAIETWTKAYHDALHPHSAGGAYVNMMMDEGQERVRASYRDNYPRLARVKATYDPHNLFRVNQNIQPAG